MLSVYNCPVNTLGFSLLTFPRIARYRPGPNSPHIRQVFARTHRGWCAKWRVEVTQRNLWKVRSRVHGRVKETCPWLLFATPTSSIRFLPTGGCVLCADNPRNRALPVFLRLLNLPPAGKRPISPRQSVLVSLAFCTLSQLLEKSFVYSPHVKSGIYLYSQGKTEDSTFHLFKYLGSVSSSNILQIL